MVPGQERAGEGRRGGVAAAASLSRSSRSTSRTVLQRFVERFIDKDVGVEEIVMVFSQDGEQVQQRIVELNHEAPCVLLVRSLAWVWWRRSPT